MLRAETCGEGSGLQEVGEEDPSRRCCSYFAHVLLQSAYRLPEFRSMALSIGYCPFRLLFIHPFRTSHGERDGTDSIFIRLEEGGMIGYGEVTLPPYLLEKPKDVIEKLLSLAQLELDDHRKLADHLNDPSAFSAHQQGARAGLQMALIDLESKRSDRTVAQLLDAYGSKNGSTLVTLGISDLKDLRDKISELPPSGALKVKVEGAMALQTIAEIKRWDDRPLFLDANQGLSQVADVLDLVAAGGDRLWGLEQPFPVDRPDLQRAAQHAVNVCIYGDESIQCMQDLIDNVGIFGGVNIKLMKCGGLDRAKNMVVNARQHGMKVMLGSMSESSLGCTAMAHLACQADIIDLDGPWLIKNDPFVGLTMREGGFVLPAGLGIGAVLKEPLKFNSICA